MSPNSSLASASFCSVSSLSVNDLRKVQLLQVRWTMNHRIECPHATRRRTGNASGFYPPTRVMDHLLDNPLPFDYHIVLKVLVAVDATAQCPFHTASFFPLALKVLLGQQFLPPSLREDEHHWSSLFQIVVHSPEFTTLRLNGE